MRRSFAMPLGSDVAVPGDAASEVLHAQGAGESAFWFFAEDIASARPRRIWR